MTLQQLKYVIAVADKGSITEAAKSLFIAQPSLSAAVRDLEEEIGTEIFARNSRGILITPEGAEFLGYARQVVQQAALIEDKYITRQAVKKRFAVSTQHYSFTSSAFVELVRAQKSDAYEFILREGKTYDSIRRSLELLGTDHVDLMLLHQAYNDYHAAWRDMERAYRDGLARAIGVSHSIPRACSTSAPSPRWRRW